MPYSTLSDVQIAVGGQANLIELADLDESFLDDGGASMSLAVEQAIRTADGIINSYIGHRHKVPLATVPDTVIDLSAAWAARILRRNRYRGQPLIDDQEAEKIDREWLTNVAKGLVSLGIEPTPEKASIVIDKAAPRDTTLSISNCRMKGFI
jgi:phage gp36-like protein